ncbi:MAG: orotidine 5'-phosphate decarboxylase / HUMPS family protein [Candidatus Methanomethylicia archaeon]
MGGIVKYDRSIIIACDVESKEKLRKLVEQTHDVERLGGYKVGSILALRYGLPSIVQIIREFTDLPIIYDHQKAMTDIPDLGKKFVVAVKESGVNALIGFPQSGPVTQEAWINACKDVGLSVIIGGEMTHPKYRRSEGGYIDDDAIDEIYLLAAKLGVDNFIIPGNKIERIKYYKKLLKPIVKELTFYLPGIIVQGGVITNIVEILGNSWHIIVGRAVYEAEDMRRAVRNIVNQIM